MFSMPLNSNRDKPLVENCSNCTIRTILESDLLASNHVVADLTTIERALLGKCLFLSSPNTEAPRKCSAYCSGRSIVYCSIILLDSEPTHY